MKKRYLAGGLALLLLLTGCEAADRLPYAREMEGMALMRAMGMDLADGTVRVTASSGVQSRGADKGDQPPLVLSSRSGTVSGACLAMQSLGDEYVFFGHVGELLLGEDMARQGLAEALDYVERDIEMRLDTGLFVVRGGTAAEAMLASAGENGSAAERLEALEDDAGLNGGTMKRSVRQVLSDLEANGASFATAVVLRPKEEGDGGQGEAMLSAGGYAVLKGEALAGWAQGDAALGTNLLMEEVEADILELPGPAGEKLALRVVEAKTGVKAVFENGTLTGLDVTCAVEANLAQAPGGLSAWDRAALDELRSALENTERERLLAALKLAQSLDADFLGLKKRAGLAAPWNWAKLRAQWDGAFSALDIRVTVTGTIQRSYDVAG